ASRRVSTGVRYTARVTRCHSPRPTSVRTARSVRPAANAWDRLIRPAWRPESASARTRTCRWGTPRSDHSSAGPVSGPVDSAERPAGGVVDVDYGRKIDGNRTPGGLGQAVATRPSSV